MDRPIIQRSIGHRHSQFRRAQQHEITRIHRPIFDRDPRQDSIPKDFPLLAKSPCFIIRPIQGSKVGVRKIGS